MNNRYHTLRLVLGDQLNHHHSWYTSINKNTLYVLMEVRSETDYAAHHIQKIIAFFAAMREFAKHLQSHGHHVLYLPIHHPLNKQSFTQNIQWIVAQYSIKKVQYQWPDEWRLDLELKNLKNVLDIPVEPCDTEHFFTQREELARFFKGKKQFLMENFYRHLRQKHHIMMENDGQPMGGEWNYDKLNREKYTGKVPVPEYIQFKNNIEPVLNDIKTHQALSSSAINHIGILNSFTMEWPINRTQALQQLDHFTTHLLPYFGTYEDAMHTQHKALFHSRLSFALNIKLLHPKEVLEKVLNQWHNNPVAIAIQQVEGFVRQVLGWREYMRGMYWLHMPTFAQLNYFEHTRELPQWYWTGHTRMNCLKHAILQSLEHAWAHHIQRLMITGNFALLAGIHPNQVDKWYLGIYIDAIEWVEITNTRGMSQFADGGLVGTKPYVSSANYIDKMSNYCEKCFYSKTLKYGERACPFNSLYWNFYHIHREKLEKNPRIGMMYVTWDKMNPTEKQKILHQAHQYLFNIHQL